MISVYVFKRSDTLSRPHQVMLFWAGLRGAVAFALAAGLDGVKEEAALKTTILVVVVLSVIVFGGTTARMLAILGVKINCVDSEGESEEEEGGDDYHDRDRDREIYLADDPYGRGSDSQALYLQHSFSNSELSLQSRPSDDEYVGGGNGSGSSGSSTGSAAERGPYNHHHHQYQRDIMPLPVASANHPDDTHWFLSFDDRYLKPIFSRSRQWNRSRRKFSGPTLHQQHRSRAAQTLGAMRGGASGMTTGRHSRFASANGAVSGAGGAAGNTHGSFLNGHGSNSNLAGTFNSSTGVSGGGRRLSNDLMGDELGMSHVRRELDRRAAAIGGSHHGSSSSLNNLGNSASNNNPNNTSSGLISGKIHDI